MIIGTRELTLMNFLGLVAASTTRSATVLAISLATAIMADSSSSGADSRFSSTLAAIFQIFFIQNLIKQKGNNLENMSINNFFSSFLFTNERN
jgi:hypothetical protein